MKEKNSYRRVPPSTYIARNTINNLLEEVSSDADRKTAAFNFKKNILADLIEKGKQSFIQIYPRHFNFNSIIEDNSPVLSLTRFREKMSTSSSVPYQPIIQQ